MILIKTFEIYYQILIFFIFIIIQILLQIVFVVYRNYLYFLHTINIWKLIKNPTDLAFWTKINIKMKAINLIKKPMKFGDQFRATAGSPSNPGGQQWNNYFNAVNDNSNLQFIRICCQFNNDIECYSDYWYVHIYNKC